MSQHRYISFFLTVFLSIEHLLSSENLTFETLESIHSYNIKTLKTALPLGWKHFCEADVDEGVIAFYPGNNPSDATIQLITSNNETISLPICNVSRIPEFGLNPDLKTVIFVNAFPSDQIYDIRGQLHRIQVARRDYNIIVVNFAQDILQLYNSVKHNAFVEGYFIAKLISTLALNGVKQADITLIGHSVGANIAALGATLHSQEDNGEKVARLIAIDPAQMCEREDVHVNANVCGKVIVLHGENEIFSLSRRLGTVDIYPNGNGLMFQPGCDSKICSHVFPFLWFADAVTKRLPTNAVKCDSWDSFRRGTCDYSSMVSLDLDFNTTNTANGSYYCITRPSQAYGLKKDDVKYKQERFNKLESTETDTEKSKL